MIHVKSGRFLQPPMYFQRPDAPGCASVKISGILFRHNLPRSVYFKRLKFDIRTHTHANTHTQTHTHIGQKERRNGIGRINKGKEGRMNK